MYQSNRVSLSSPNMQGYLSSGGSSSFGVNDYGNRSLPRDDGMNARGVIVEPFQPMARTVSTHPNYHGAMEDERFLIPENSTGIWHENGYDRAGQFYEGGRKRKSSDDIAGYQNQLWPHVANWESGTSSRHLDFERHEMCNGSVYDVPTMRPIAGPERGDFIMHRPFPPVESSMAADYRRSALSARGRFEGPQRSERNMVHLNRHLESGFSSLGSHSGHFLVRSSLEPSADMERRSSFPRERIDNMARDGGFFNSFPPERDWAASVHREGAPIISNPRGSSHNLYPTVSNIMNGMSYAPVHWNHHQRLHMSSRGSTQTFLSGHKGNFSHLPGPLASQVDVVFNPSVDSVGYQYHDHRRSSSVDHHNEHNARSVRRMPDIPIARFHALYTEDGLHDRPVPEQLTQETRIKPFVLGKATLNLSKYISFGEADKKNMTIPVSCCCGAMAPEAALSIAINFVEMQSGPDAVDSTNAVVASASPGVISQEKEELSAIKSSLRKVKIIKDYVAVWNTIARISMKV